MKQLTPMGEVNEYMQKNIDRVEQLIVRNLSYVGESCLTAARSTNTYKDRTGNLRSSIGYVVVKNGQIINKAIYEAGSGTDGKTGVTEGVKFMQEIARQFPDGIALIVVAGMNYAGYVSAQGYDVLDSAELQADKLVPQIMQQLGFIRK